MDTDDLIVDTWGVSRKDWRVYETELEIGVVSNDLGALSASLISTSNYLDTRITNNSNYFQSEVDALSNEIAGIVPIVYNNNTFTGGTFDYIYATSNVDITNSSCCNIYASNTIISADTGTVTIGTVSSTNSTIQYSPLINSTVTNLTAYCNVDISNSVLSNIYASNVFLTSDNFLNVDTITSTNATLTNSYLYTSTIDIVNTNDITIQTSSLCNLYAYSNVNIADGIINTIYASNADVVNCAINTLNIDTINTDNYTNNYDALISIANVASNMYIAGDANLYSATTSNVYVSQNITSFNGIVYDMNVLSNVNATNCSMSNVTSSNVNFNSGYITNFDIINANIAYQPRVASSADRVSFFFDAVAIPPNTTTYQLLSFTFTNDARLIYEYYNASGVKTVATFNLQDLP